MNDFYLSVIKFAMALLLLPLVMASAVAFNLHLDAMYYSTRDFFMWGAGAFIITFMFLYQFWAVFDFGQKLVAGAFKFMEPYNRIVARFIPFYVLVTFALYYLTIHFFHVTTLTPYYLFFIGFFSVMHILLVAQEMQSEEKTPIKPTYLFWMGIIFIFNVCLIIFMFDILRKRWSFPGFFGSTLLSARYLYLIILKKIIPFAF